MLLILIKMNRENGLKIDGNIFIDSGYITIKAARSSGPGGQHVNKTSTKVELHFDFMNCANLSGETREMIGFLTQNKRDSEGQLLITSQKTRSFYANLADAQDKLKNIIINALRRPAARIATKPSHASRINRLEQKKRRGASKRGRQEWKRARFDD